MWIFQATMGIFPPKTNGLEGPKMMRLGKPVTPFKYGHVLSIFGIYVKFLVGTLPKTNS